MKRFFQVFNRTPVQQRQSIVVVSGLPRSGTSMMMQMLAAGGLDVLTDDHRQPDENNPRGYYEFAPVKRLHMGEDDWVHEAVGKSVKVISTQLHHLPDVYDYQVILMTRPLIEVLRSQAAMLKQMGQSQNRFNADKLATEYEQHLNAVLTWCDTHDHIRLLTVDYLTALEQPETTAHDVQAFLDRPLDIPAMISAVDPALHRQRAAESSPQ